jgi:hypothetical protein
MTIAMAPVGLQPLHDVSWRALEGGLWVARREGKHLGSVQPGRRWLAADAEGEPIGTFRSFREAQLAVADPAAHHAPVHRASGSGLAVTAFALAAAVSAAGWMWTSLFL